MDLYTNSENGFKVWDKSTKLNILNDSDFDLKWYEYVQIFFASICTMLAPAILLALIWSQ